MASDLIVPVVILENVQHHSNADKLDTAVVLGYQVCTRRDQYKTGDKVVYFPADVLLPKEWAEKFNVINLLKGKDKDRVGKVRLRGEPSFGLAVPIPEGQNWEEGQNVADYFGCKKYEPPIKTTCGDAEAYDSEIDPIFEKYTDIQNGRILTNIFVEGEEVIATEKIHGTNCRFGIVDGHEVAGSMGLRRKKPLTLEETSSNHYWFPWTIKEIKNLIDHLSEHCYTHIIYGEVYGGSIQNLTYGIPKGKGLGFRLFDIKCEGKFLDWDTLFELCQKFNVNMVPVLYRGPYSMSKMKELSEGKTTLVSCGGDVHIREGIVVKPVKEKIHPSIGRVILKYISTEYSLDERISDSKDI